MNELNKKMVEFAEINLAGVPEGCEPDFLHSLDLCFKYLVPKLEALYINYSGDAFYACAYFNDKRQELIAEAPALALCKVIEQLIKEE